MPDKRLLDAISPLLTPSHTPSYPYDPTVPFRPMESHDIGPQYPRLQLGHTPNPPIPQGNIRPIQTGDQFPAERASEGISGLYDFIGKIADLANASGLTDFGNIDAGPSTAITRFLSPSGVPMKEMREAFTRQFLADAAKHQHSGVNEVAQFMAQRYPRIAAHTHIAPGILPPSEEGTAAATFLKERVDPQLAYAGIRNLDERRVPLVFGPRLKGSDADQIANAMGHEMTHVAQKLGNPEADNEYELLQRLMDYPEVPYEENARFSGTKVERAFAKATGRPYRDMNARMGYDPVKKTNIRKVVENTAFGPDPEPEKIDRTIRNLSKILGPPPPEILEQAEFAKALRGRNREQLQEVLKRRKLGPIKVGNKVLYEMPGGAMEEKLIANDSERRVLNGLLQSGNYKIFRNSPARSRMNDIIGHKIDEDGERLKRVFPMIGESYLRKNAAKETTVNAMDMLNGARIGDTVTYKGENGPVSKVISDENELNVFRKLAKIGFPFTGIE